jgi:hypothetical protein
MKVPPTINAVYQKALENNLAFLYWDRSILTNETAPHDHPDITLFEKTI